MLASLALDAFIAASLGVLYAYVGFLVARRRPTTQEGRTALASFRTWWFGLSAVTFLGAARELLAAFGILDRAPHAVLTYFLVPPLALALWGLADYLVYLHTGTTRWRRPLQVAHVAMAAFFVALLVHLHPLGATAEAWSAPMRYENELRGPLLAAALAVLLGPVLALSVAYLGLAFRVEDPTARFRILTVSGAFLFWFGSVALASATGWNAWDYWPLVARGIALLATLVIILAYAPPRVIRERFGRADGRSAGPPWTRGAGDPPASRRD